MRVATPGTRNLRRGEPLLAVLALAAAVLVGFEQPAQAITVAGELIVDLRATDLQAGSSVWVNQDTSGSTVGDFHSKGGGALNVVNAIDGVGRALYIPYDDDTDGDGIIGASAVSSLTTPSSVEGNNTRSVEAWVYALSLPGSSTPVGWGHSGNSQMSSFRYNNNSVNGMFSGWFIDAGWDGATLPTGEWTHVAWTYDGSVVRGYLNGQQAAAISLTSNENWPLTTQDDVIVVGAGRSGDTDSFDGYIADVRVHSGLLDATGVMNNFNEGIAIGPSGVRGDYNNDGVVDAADYATWRNALGTSTQLMNEEVSPTVVDIADYLYWRERYGATDPGDPPYFAQTAAPEPTAAVLGLLAAHAMGLAVRPT